MMESSTVPRGARNPFLVGGALRGIISPDTIGKTFHNLILVQQKTIWLQFPINARFCLAKYTTSAIHTCTHTHTHAHTHTQSHTHSHTRTHTHTHTVTQTVTHRHKDKIMIK